MRTIDNKLETGKVKIFYIIMLTLILAFTAYYAFERNEEYVRTIFLSMVILIAAVYAFMLFLRLNYFFIQDTGDFILVRYYSAHPFLRQYKAFKLPVATLESYTYKKSVWGLKREISIKAKSTKGEFVFPPVSITLVSKAERKELFEILDEYTSN